MTTTPLLSTVAATATMSRTGSADAENDSVLTPTTLGAEVPPHVKPSSTSVGGIGAVGRSANTKLFASPGAISTGVYGARWVTASLVSARVGWKPNAAGTGVRGSTRHTIVGSAPALTIVANAVAVEPTWTERLLGRTAATSSGTGPVVCPVSPVRTTKSPPCPCTTAAVNREGRRSSPAHLAVIRRNAPEAGGVADGGANVQRQRSVLPLSRRRARRG